MPQTLRPVPLMVRVLPSRGRGAELGLTGPAEGRGEWGTCAYVFNPGCLAGSAIVSFASNRQPTAGGLNQRRPSCGGWWGPCLLGPCSSGLVLHRQNSDRPRQHRSMAASRRGSLWIPGRTAALSVQCGAAGTSLSHS